VPDQFAEDGWYVQHSLNYLRMALDQVVVAERVLTAARGRGISDAAADRVRAAIALLVELHDEDTGEVPNHGANDGSMVLPITTGPYGDFRPSITAAAATFDASLPLSFCASAESLAWLGADEIPRRDDPSVDRVVTGSSGWVSARRGRARAFIRAGEYHSNPSHIDVGQVDLWIDGEMRAIDPGTYRYTAVPPWGNGLAGIGVHNTIDIPSLPAAVKGMRFLWLERPAAVVTRTDQSDGATVVVIRNKTWEARGVTHVRRCTLEGSEVTVVDEIDTHGQALEVQVHWLLPEHAPLPEITAPGGGQLSVVRASTTTVEGWRSPHYGEKRAATSITFVIMVTGREVVQTRFLATNLPRES
jgi:hypothetical protein